MPAFLDRYLAGERIAVWNELMALGEAVRRKPVQDDAVAVAEEIMRRARHNIELLIHRLAGIGYRFAAPAVDRELDKIRKKIADTEFNSLVPHEVQKAVEEGRLPASALNPIQIPLAILRRKKVALEAELERMATMPPLENPRVFYPPEGRTMENLKATEKFSKGPLPLSIRSWYKHVGYVSLGGAHPVLNPDGFTTADPIVVHPLPDLMKELVIGRQNDRTVLTISLNDLNKIGLTGGKPYTITIPTPCADVELENEWHRTTFVGYLRKSFEWGGFPGWERDPTPPLGAIAELAKGLLPI